MILLAGKEAGATDVIGGRIIWTYQTSKVQAQKEKIFVQHYELTLKDRLADRSDLNLRFFLDTSKNYTRDMTLLRYRFDLGLIHRYYKFEARWAPKQETTPLESALEQEFTEQRYALDVFHPVREDYL